MHEFDKQTNETYLISGDFSDVLAEGEIISSVDVAAYIGDVDVTSLVIGSTAIDGSDIVVRVQGGIDRRKYKIELTVTTSGANIYEEEIYMTVWDK